MVKILHVVQNLEIGGAETLVHRIVKSQDPREFRSGVCCLRTAGPLGEDLRSSGVPVRALNATPGFRFSTVNRLRGILASEEIDVIHAHTYSPFFFSACAAVLFPRVVLVFTEHGRLHPEPRNLKRQIVNPLLARRADHIVSISRATRRAMAVHDNFPEDRIRVVWNGVRLVEPDGAGDPAEVRREIDVPADAFVLGMAARLVELKNFPMALRAFRVVRDRMPACRLVIAGDGPERERLRILARELGVARDVRFLGMRDDLDRLYGSFDLFLISSRTEGVSMTLLEAMARGKPAVVTRVGGNPEVVLDQRTGFVVKSEDHRAMAFRILELLRDPARLTSMGVESAERVRRHFSFDRMLASYEALYVGGRGGSS